MILKSYEISKINLKENNLILFYGKNEGLKIEEISKIVSTNLDKDILNYEEKEILENEDNFIENLLTKSLFDEKKIIIIKRSTDKILGIIEDLYSKKIEDIIIILNADNLEKKSKLRSFFEKSKKLVCVPFYPDNEQTLSKLTYNFFKNKNISISQANINLIINNYKDTDNDEQKDILDSPDIVELSHPVENTDNEDLEVPSYLRKGNI